MLQGAIAAARLGDAATVQDLLGGAHEAAVRLGGDYNHYWTCFGPTNVEFHRAAAAVEMGEGGRAIEAHMTINPDSFGRMMPERRAHHLLDVARGYAQVGDLDRAGELLVEADKFAPAEIRCRPIAHETVLEVVRRTRGRPPVPIAELAENMNLRL
jgi:hypothetical protein